MKNAGLWLSTSGLTALVCGEGCSIAARFGESDADHTVLTHGQACKESRSLWFDMRTTGQGEATQSWEGVLLSFRLAFGYIPNSSNLYFLGPLADSTSATGSTDRRLVVFTPPSHPRQPQLLEAAGVPVSVVSSHSEVSTSLQLPVSRQPHHGLLFSISIYLTHSCSPAADSCFSDREEFCDAGDPSAVGSGVY